MTVVSDPKRETLSKSPFLIPRKSMFKWLFPLVEHVTGLSILHKHYLKRPTNLSEKAFLTHTLDTLKISYTTHSLSSTNIPASGPLIIVANHPLGGVEGVILAKILLEFRPDLLIMANHFLKRIPELDALFIGVNVFEGKEAIRENLHAIKQANKHLAKQGALLIFPAGEVSTYSKHNGQLEDKQWNRLAGKLAQSHLANCLPIFIGGQNSKRFYLAGKVHPILRTLMLGRELLNKKNKTIPIYGGELIPYTAIAKMNNANEVTQFLRSKTYAIKENL